MSRILKEFLLKNKDQISKENLIEKNLFSNAKRSSDYAQAIMEIGALIKAIIANLHLLSIN